MLSVETYSLERVMLGEGKTQSKLFGVTGEMTSIQIVACVESETSYSLLLALRHSVLILGTYICLPIPLDTRTRS